MRSIALTLGSLLVLTLSTMAHAEGPKTLIEARKNFHTSLGQQKTDRAPLAEPPRKLFTKVDYLSPVGKLGAYLSTVPKDGKKHPAIIWVHGGFCNSVDDFIWSDASPDDDQTAAAYRKAGIVMMFPSLRGGNENPGSPEYFLGEVDDVIAAAKFLSQQPGIDPDRIYLGGHSTGGTLALLVAECSDRFRAIFAFGPVDDVSGYGPQYCPVDHSKMLEILMRSPGYWLDCIKRPTFIFEGALKPSNVGPLKKMESRCKNPLVHFSVIPGKGHLSVLGPMNELIARKILNDTGSKSTVISFTDKELK